MQPLSDLISAPLVAAVVANAKMAQAQVDFMLAHCFTKNEDGYMPKMVKMQLTRKTIAVKDPSESSQTTEILDTVTTFNLPILTIIPLNSLTINDMEVKFEVGIEKLVTDVEGEPQLLGNIIKDQDEQVSRVDISLKARQSPLPQGVLTIIDAFSKNVQP